MGCCACLEPFCFPPLRGANGPKAEGGRLSREAKETLRRGLVRSGVPPAAGTCMALSGIFVM